MPCDNRREKCTFAQEKVDYRKRLTIHGEKLSAGKLLPIY